MFQAALLDTMNTHFGAVPDGGVDLHGVDAERAVAIDRDHLPVRDSERRRDREGHADAEAAESAGIHVGLAPAGRCGRSSTDRRRRRSRCSRDRRAAAMASKMARGWILPSLAGRRLGSSCGFSRMRSRWRLRRPSAQALSRPARDCRRPPPSRRARARAWRAVPAGRAGCRSVRRHCRQCG